jgi:small subunit ribosomal protein S14
MSKITKFIKDKKFRLNFEKKELSLILLKYSIYSNNNNRYKQFLYHRFLRRFKLNWSRARIVNRCIHTGRSFWVLRKFRLSRMTFRMLCDNGNIHGVRRSSW